VALLGAIHEALAVFEMNRRLGGESRLLHGQDSPGMPWSGFAAKSPVHFETRPAPHGSRQAAHSIIGFELNPVPLLFPDQTLNRVVETARRPHNRHRTVLQTVDLIQAGKVHTGTA